MNINIHEVKGVTIQESQESGGTFYRNIYIKTEKGMIEVSVYGDKKEDVQVTMAQSLVL